jgi:hypothetical protein
MDSTTNNRTKSIRTIEQTKFKNTRTWFPTKRTYKSRSISQSRSNTSILFHNQTPPTRNTTKAPSINRSVNSSALPQTQPTMATLPWSRIPPLRQDRPTSPPFPPSPDSTTPEIRAWIQQWQFSRIINVSEETLSNITWTGSHLAVRSAKKLSADLVAWGFHRAEARVLVADILKAIERDRDLYSWLRDGRTEGITTSIGKFLTTVGIVAIIYLGTRISELSETG